MQAGSASPARGVAEALERWRGLAPHQPLVLLVEQLLPQAAPELQGAAAVAAAATTTSIGRGGGASAHPLRGAKQRMMAQALLELRALARAGRLLRTTLRTLRSYLRAELGSPEADLHQARACVCV